ncbi:hypothetical protein Tco_1474118 [Tanacetum coccineum]
MIRCLQGLQKTSIYSRISSSLVFSACASFVRQKQGCACCVRGIISKSQPLISFLVITTIDFGFVCFGYEIGEDMPSNERRCLGTEEMLVEVRGRDCPWGCRGCRVKRDSRVELVDRTLQAREKTIQMLQFNLKKPQDRMKSPVDKHRTEREFVVGKVAYKLKLLDNAKVHPVFHVSQLKKCLSSTTAMRTCPKGYAQGLIGAKPVKLSERRMVKQQNRMSVFGLIQ